MAVGPLGIATDSSAIDAAPAQPQRTTPLLRVLDGVDTTAVSTEPQLQVVEIEASHRGQAPTVSSVSGHFGALSLHGDGLELHGDALVDTRWWLDTEHTRGLTLVAVEDGPGGPSYRFELDAADGAPPTPMYCAVEAFGHVIAHPQTHGRGFGTKPTEPREGPQGLLSCVVHRRGGHGHRGGLLPLD